MQRESLRVLRHRLGSPCLSTDDILRNNVRARCQRDERHVKRALCVMSGLPIFMLFESFKKSALQLVEACVMFRHC